MRLAVLVVLISLLLACGTSYRDADRYRIWLTIAPPLDDAPTSDRVEVRAHRLKLCESVFDLIDDKKYTACGTIPVGGQTIEISHLNADGATSHVSTFVTDPSGVVELTPDGDWFQRVPTNFHIISISIDREHEDVVGVGDEQTHGTFSDVTFSDEANTFQIPQRWFAERLQKFVGSASEAEQQLDYSRAISTLGDCSQLHPESQICLSLLSEVTQSATDFYLDRGQEALAKGDSANARKFHERCVELTTDSRCSDLRASIENAETEESIERAGNLLAAHKFEEAEAALDECVDVRLECRGLADQIEQDYLAFLLQSALQYEVAGDSGNALIVAKTCLKRDGQYAECLGVLSRSKRNLGTDFLGKAKDAIKEKDYVLARTQAKSCLEYDPDRSECGKVFERATKTLTDNLAKTAVVEAKEDNAYVAYGSIKKCLELDSTHLKCLEILAIVEPFVDLSRVKWVTAIHQGSGVEIDLMMANSAGDTIMPLGKVTIAAYFTYNGRRTFELGVVLTEEIAADAYSGSGSLALWVEESTLRAALDAKVGAYLFDIYISDYHYNIVFTTKVVDLLGNAVEATDSVSWSK